MNRLGDPPYTCLITRGEATSENYTSEKARLLQTVRDAVQVGVSIIQIREKRLPGRMLFDLVRDVVAATVGSGSLGIVNDRADVAIAARADGIHLPENSIPPDVIQSVFSKKLIVGVSIHSLEAARTAADSGVDYVLFGPVFETPGKGMPTGVERLSQVCSVLRGVPVLALGGVSADNFASVMEAGAAGIAAIRALNDPESRARVLREVNVHKRALR